MQNKLDNLPSIMETISQVGFDPKKSLGQNFLTDLSLTRKIARSAGDLSKFNIIEVGPGPGALTRALLYENAAKVWTIDKDPRAYLALQPVIDIVGNDKLEVIVADGLQYDYKMIPAPRKIIANLPYNISTKLLINWLKLMPEFESLTLMFQKEVANRIMAAPKCKAYGRLSIMSQYRCNINHSFDIAPSAFFPPPKVTSSVINVKYNNQKNSNIDWSNLEYIVKLAFAHRRKKLRTCFKNDPNLNAICQQLGISLDQRAEELSINDYCQIVELYHKNSIL